MRAQIAFDNKFALDTTSRYASMKLQRTSALKAIGIHPTSSAMNRALPSEVVEFTNGATAHENTIKAILHHHAISKNSLNFLLGRVNTTVNLC